MLYDENNRVMINSISEVNNAKYRVSLKRKIRRFLPKVLYNSINNLSTETLENMTF